MSDARIVWNYPTAQLFKEKGINEELAIFSAETFARYMNPFVPFQTGILSSSYITGADNTNGYVKYTQRYARAQFFGDNFKHNLDYHPKATSRWDKAAWNADKDRIMGEINEYRKGISK